LLAHRASCRTRDAALYVCSRVSLNLVANRARIPEEESGSQEEA
jgi:hypothetical protein